MHELSRFTQSTQEGASSNITQDLSDEIKLRKQTDESDINLSYPTNPTTRDYNRERIK